MHQQYIDWFVVEFIMYLFLHCLRVPWQVYRARRSANRSARTLSPHSLRLQDVLADQGGFYLVEHALKAELASENLEFFHRASRWKRAFAKDSASTQREAQFLVESFVGMDSPFPINISDGCAKQILTAREGHVEAGVFDEAIEQVLQMMEWGVFQRLRFSPEFSRWIAKSERLLAVGAHEA
jgi:hypothetical protein